MSSNNCKHCGKNIESSAKFCPECGKSLTTSSKSQSPGKGVNNHLIMIIVLILTAALFSGYQLMKSDDKQAGHSQTAPMEAPMGGSMDMASMGEELPDDFETLVNMGNAMMDKGQYPMAIVCYQKAIESNPESVDVMVDMATCQHAMGDNETAIMSFEKALSLQPGHQIGKFNLGIVYYTVGNDDKARQWWNTLLGENPADDLKARTQELIKKLDEK